MEKLAVIGTGIAGMGAAYYLHRDFDITVFESADRIGGHTNTVYVDEGDRKVPVDTGFIVFNNHTYPRLVALFKALQVPVKTTNMSFAAQVMQDGLEYCGSGINQLFAQRRRIFSPRYIRFLLQLNRFNQTCTEVLENTDLHPLSIADYLKLRGFSKDLLHWYVLPMSSALWSTPPETTAKFPALTLVRFFKNHGFLGLNTQFQWYTVDGGSEEYKKRLIAPFRDRIQTGNGIRSVHRTEAGVVLTDSRGVEHVFDKVIIAAHADEALAMLGDATEKERQYLSPFAYSVNTATLHTDTAVMPKKRLAWSSWNYRTEYMGSRLQSSCTYWMNSLQGVSDRRQYFVTINDPGIIDHQHIIQEIHYTHPIFTVEAMHMQARLPELNTNGKVYFCGSYFRYGFHEDALMSAAQVCEDILGRSV